MREIANARAHRITGEVPLVRLELERERLQPMATPWLGLIQTRGPEVLAIRSLQQKNAQGCYPFFVEESGGTADVADLGVNR